MKTEKEIFIVKASGERERFSEKKLRFSLEKFFRRVRPCGTCISWIPSSAQTCTSSLLKSLGIVKVVTETKEKKCLILG